MEFNLVRELGALALAMVSLMLIFSGKIFNDQYRVRSINGLIFVEIMLIVILFTRF